jgi:hypothetical protein
MEAGNQPLSVCSDLFSIHRLDTENFQEAVDFVSEIFSNEPLGLACGHVQPWRHRLIASAIADIQRHEESTGIKPSLLIKFKNEIVGAVIVMPPPDELAASRGTNACDPVTAILDQDEGAVRLFKAMNDADECAALQYPQIRVKQLPEFFTGALHPNFTGQVGTGISLGSFMYSLCARVMEDETNWIYVKSHSNDASWKSKERAGGWDLLYRVQYSDMKGGVLVDSTIKGSLNVVVYNLRQAK